MLVSMPFVVVIPLLVTSVFLMDELTEALQMQWC